MSQRGERGILRETSANRLLCMLKSVVLFLTIKRSAVYKMSQ